MSSKSDSLAEKNCEEAVNTFGMPLPDWFYYVSHHSCNELDHCIRIKVFNSKPYFFCARCFGAYLGFLMGFLGILYWRYISQPFLEIIMLGFAAPAIVDWGSQNLGYRKSFNSLRIITGFLYGFAIPITMFQIGYWLFLDIYRVILPVTAFSLYLTIIIILNKVKNLRNIKKIYP